MILERQVENVSCRSALQRKLRPWNICSHACRACTYGWDFWARSASVLRTASGALQLLWRQNPVRAAGWLLKSEPPVCAPCDTVLSLCLCLMIPKSVLRLALRGAWGPSLRGGAVPRPLAFLVLPRRRRQTECMELHFLVLASHLWASKDKRQLSHREERHSGQHISSNTQSPPSLPGGGGGARCTPGSRPWTPLPESVSPSPKDKTGREVSDRTWGTEFVFLDQLLDFIVRLASKLFGIEPR